MDDKSLIDPNFTRFVGWGYTNDQYSECIQKYFSKPVIDYISQKITMYLDGVVPNRKIVVPFDKITFVMSQIYNTRQPVVGDIFTRYTIGDIEADRNDLKECIDQTIETIVNQIRNEYETIQNNNKLSIWNSVYGTQNVNGLLAHPPIKLRNKRPDPFQFNMNY